MKKLFILCFLFLIISINAYSDIFYLRFKDGNFTRIIAYSAVVVRNSSGTIIFKGKTDKYGRVKIITTSGKTIEVTYNGKTYKNPVTITNSTRSTTVTFR